MKKSIALPIHSTSTLKWEEERKQAHEALTEGFSLFWEFDLPLNDSFQLPLLKHSLDHFTTHFFPEFQESSSGALLYRGYPPSLEPLLELLPILPENLPLYLSLSPPEEEIFRFLSLPGAEHFSLLDFPYTSSHSTALLLPAHNWTTFLSRWRTLAPPFRVIAEHRLTEEWHGVEKLIVFSEGVSLQGLRKLRGFLAAQGNIEVIGKELAL